MSGKEREAHLEMLKGTEGSFKGQAVFGQGNELGDKMDDAQYGKYEIFATVEEPVLFEITMEYRLYSDQDFFTGIPSGTHIEFVGTLVDLDFQDNSKPRKMNLKVKATSVDRIK